jgi:hypothetical protein
MYKASLSSRERKEKELKLRKTHVLFSIHLAYICKIVFVSF